VDPATSAAAPGSAQDARTRPVTNHTAPVDAGSCAAVETAGGTHPKDGSTRPKEGSTRPKDGSGHITTTRSGGPASGAGIAGMAGSAGAGRPVRFTPAGVAVRRPRRAPWQRARGRPRST